MLRTALIAAALLFTGPVPAVAEPVGDALHQLQVTDAVLVADEIGTGLGQLLEPGRRQPKRRNGD